MFTSSIVDSLSDGFVQARQRYSRWESIAGVCAGGTTFVLGLHFTRKAAQAMGVTSNKLKPLGSLVGTMGMLLSGGIAGHSAKFVDSMLHRVQSEPDDHANRAGKTLFPTVETAFYCGCAAIGFYMVGGRGKHLTPSSLFRPGAFAKEWIHASGGAEYATQTQRFNVFIYGKKYGCHHCGRMLWSPAQMHCDHMPPNALNEANKPQQFYPQCVDCSSLQSNAVRTRTDTSVLPTLLRRSSIWWLPSHMLWAILGPAIVLLLSLVNRDEIEETEHKQVQEIRRTPSPIERLQQLRREQIQLQQELHDIKSGSQQQEARKKQILNQIANIEQEKHSIKCIIKANKN